MKTKLLQLALLGLLTGNALTATAQISGPLTGDTEYCRTENVRLQFTPTIPTNGGQGTITDVSWMCMQIETNIGGNDHCHDISDANQDLDAQILHQWGLYITQVGSNHVYDIELTAGDHFHTEIKNFAGGWNISTGVYVKYNLSWVYNGVSYSSTLESDHHPVKLGKNPGVDFKINGNSSAGLQEVGHNSVLTMDDVDFCFDEEATFTFRAINNDLTVVQGAPNYTVDFLYNNYPTNWSMSDLATLGGFSWTNGDQYRIQMHVEGLEDDGNHTQYIRHGVTDAEVYLSSPNALRRDKVTNSPYGAQHYAYYMNRTSANGPLIVPQINANGENSTFAEGLFLAIHEFDASTWTVGPALMVGDWVCTGPSCTQIPRLLNNTIPNNEFPEDQLYIITYAVGPVWSAEYPLLMVGDYEEIEQHTGKQKNLLIGGDQGEFASRAYPNPTEGWVLLTVNAAFEAGTDIIVHDLLGNVVLQERFNGLQSRINLSEKPAGVYLVTVQNDHGSMTHKVQVF